MLKKLAVKSFAIIEDLTISFQDKMTVLTGQTGAGKSLIIDTISLLLGARADSDMIRYGDTKAYIEGEFTYNNPKITEELLENQIPVEDTLTIRREINLNGKNTIKINNSLVSLLVLKALAPLLADIHVQHDTYMLINPQTYLSFIDPTIDDNFNKISNDYVLNLEKYLNSKKKYDSIINSKKAYEDRLEFLLFQKQELEVFNLQIDEDIIITEKINKLANYDKIFQNLKECYENLENEYFSIDNISRAADNLTKISHFDSDLKINSEKLNECFYTLEEIKTTIRKQIDSLDFNSNELDNLNERLNDLNNLKKKYKMSNNELIDYYKKVCFEIDIATNYDNVLNEALEDLKNKYDLLVACAKKLSFYRREIAQEIEKSVTSECRDLDLPNTSFKIAFKELEFKDCHNHNIFKPNGCDEVDFLISLNLGEPLKSLHKTASGGEMSRIMLAFKTYFSTKTKLSLMVFDEIDSGISGTTAIKIAQKLKEISKYTQILCITHLPQVAASADNHLYIFKEEENGRTKTNIMLLDYDKRVESLAIMLGGSKISRYAIEHAKELLNQYV